MTIKPGAPQLPANILPGCVSALHRNPHLRDSFGIGASLADWAVAGV